MLGLAFCLTRSSLKYWAEGSTWWGEVEWERMGEIEGGKSVEMSRVSCMTLDATLLHIYLPLLSFPLHYGFKYFISPLRIHWRVGGWLRVYSECKNASASFRSFSVLHLFLFETSNKMQVFLRWSFVFAKSSALTLKKLRRIGCLFFDFY